MKSSSRTILSRFALFATIAASPLLMTDAHAFGGKPGGPFSNGTYFPNEGTFSAVIRAKDLSGTLQFSTSSAAASSGVATIYNDGDTYIGNSSGVVNPASNEITVTFQASAAGQGQRSFFTNQRILEKTFEGTAEQTESWITLPDLQTTFFDSLYCNGVATCKTSNDFPNQKFSGSGNSEFQSLQFVGNSPFLDAEKKNISVSGVRVSNSATQFATTTVTPPSVNEYTVLVIQQP